MTTLVDKWSGITINYMVFLYVVIIGIILSQSLFRSSVETTVLLDTTPHFGYILALMYLNSIETNDPKLKIALYVTIGCSVINLMAIPWVRIQDTTASAVTKLSDFYTFADAARWFQYFFGSIASLCVLFTFMAIG